MTCWLCGFKTTKLHTNAKTPTCKNGPCQICTAVADIDDEINQAVVALRRLIFKRWDLRSEQNRAHDPMHRLPVELKNYIFELVVPLRNAWGELEDPNMATTMPSVLASICRGWRDIALSNPSLWSTIHTVLGTLPGLSESIRINFVPDWILRSRTLPLTFHVRDVMESRNALLSSVLDAISQCSDRLESLSLDVSVPCLQAFQQSHLQYHHLTRLRILLRAQSEQNNEPLLLFNATASPEKIHLYHVPFRWLQISWNRLSCAKVDDFDLEEIMQLFQHALQMTDCDITSLRRWPQNFSMPPIIHQRLKKLTLRCVHRLHVASIFLASLTLPCLQEFGTNNATPLIHLPALVHRSSCPLTRLVLYTRFQFLHSALPELQPLPGVTDLVVGTVDSGADTELIKKIIFNGHLPALHHLTLLLQPFLILWNEGVITLLLDRKRPQPSGPNEGRLDKIIVVGPRRELDDMWNSDVGKQLKALSISLRDDGFEFLL